MIDPMMGIPYAWSTEIPDEDRRELRDRAVQHAVYLHGEPDMTFDRQESVEAVLKTAQTLYDWIVGNNGS